MNHVILSSSIVTFLLCGPAVAQPAAPAPAPAPRPAPTAAAPLRVELTVTTATAARTHQVLVLEGDCATVWERGADYLDDIEVCTGPQPSGVTVRTKWRVNEGSSEYKASWTSVIARSGARIEGGRTGNVRFALVTK